MSGNFNMLVAAAIVAADQPKPGPGHDHVVRQTVADLAVHPRDWRVVAVTAAVMFAITSHGSGCGRSGSPTRRRVRATARTADPIPFAFRAVVAIGLLLLFRPWSRATAAFVAIPAMYWISLVVLLAPIAVILRRLPRKPDEGP